MKTFDLYAACYDLLNRGKDYSDEAVWVASLLPGGPLALLELGCGTGGHALALAAAGHAVTGVDLSAEMVARAEARRVALPGDLAARLTFVQGDARHYRAGRIFDAVLSLFHVASYQASNEDLAAYLDTARAHLAPGGRFVFDFWYGPAVLSDRPRQVVREVADDRVEVRRETTPTVRVNDNIVDVRFDLTVRAREGGQSQAFHEVHTMRYLFLPELRAALALTGFDLVQARAWLRDGAPDDTTWYACVVAEAR